MTPAKKEKKTVKGKRGDQASHQAARRYIFSFGPCGADGGGAA